MSVLTKLGFLLSMIQPILLMIGSIIFIIGSYYFLPHLDTDRGLFLFDIGLVLFILALMPDFFKSIYGLWKRFCLETVFLFLITSFFEAGCGTFLAGCLIYNHEAHLGVWLFIIGSFCFLMASLLPFPFLERFKKVEETYLVDVKEIEQKKQLMQDAGLSYLEFVGNLSGSMLFLVGSIFFYPDTHLGSFGGYLFVIGSIFFLFSSIFLFIKKLLMR